MLSPSRVAFPSLLLLLSASACFADSQPGVPAPTSIVPLTPVIRVESVPSNEGLHLQVDVSNGDATQVIIAIANTGNLQVAIKDGVHAVLKSVALKDSTPEKALQTVCKAATLGSDVKNGVWVISPIQPADAAQSKVVDDLVFTDVEVTKLLELMATEFDMPIAIAGDVGGKIPYIRLHGYTPRQSLDAIAEVANLKIQETDDGTLILTANKDH